MHLIALAGLLLAAVMVLTLRRKPKQVDDAAESGNAFAREVRGRRVHGFSGGRLPHSIEYISRRTFAKNGVPRIDSAGA